MKLISKKETDVRMAKVEYFTYDGFEFYPTDPPEFMLSHIISTFECDDNDKIDLVMKVIQPVETKKRFNDFKNIQVIDHKVMGTLPKNNDTLSFSSKIEQECCRRFRNETADIIRSFRLSYYNAPTLTNPSSRFKLVKKHTWPDDLCKITITKK